MMLPLVRGWAVDWLASHDPTACPSLLAEDYELTIGSVRLTGRDAYVDATLGQLGNYPGLVLTVHEVVSDGQRAAVRFTEHGAAAHRGGHLAAWTGVALFERRGDLLSACWAQEDYAARSHQLASGEPDQPGHPATAPWDVAELPGDAEAEQVVGAWLAAPDPASDVTRDDRRTGLTDDPQVTDVRPDVLFSSGRTVAFHGRTSVDGFDLGVAGILRVGPDGEVTGHLVSDRAGLGVHRKAVARG